MTEDTKQGIVRDEGQTNDISHLLLRLIRHKKIQ